MLKQWIAFLWLIIISMTAEAHISPRICSGEIEGIGFPVQPINNDDILLRYPDCNENLFKAPVESISLSPDKNVSTTISPTPRSKPREGPLPGFIQENTDKELREPSFDCFFLEVEPPLNQSQNASLNGLPSLHIAVIPIMRQRIGWIKSISNPNLTGGSTLTRFLTIAAKFREQNIASAVTYPSSLEYP